MKLLIIWEGGGGELDRRVIDEDESALDAIKAMCGDCDIYPGDVIRIMFEENY